MTISIKPTASGSTIEQDGSTILTVDGSGNLSTPNTFTSTGAITGTGGIYLGGTSAANLLDDYEEGTWTPRFYRSTDQTELNITSYQRQWGVYQRVGQWVTVQCELSTNDSTSIGTPGGNLLIGTLPFTAGGITGINAANATGYAKRFGTNNQPRSILVPYYSSFAHAFRVDYTTEELDTACSANISAFTNEYNRIMFQITYLITGSE